MLLHAQTLQDAKETIQYQIRHLKKYFSREQRRCWNIRLKRIQASLKAYKSIGIVPIIKQKSK
jgi:hypothetical protein